MYPSIWRQSFDEKILSILVAVFADFNRLQKWNSDIGSFKFSRIHLVLLFLLDRIKFEEEKYVFYRHFSRISNSIGTNSGNLLVIPPQEISGYRRFRPNRRNCSLEMILCWVLVYLVCSVNGVLLKSVPFKVWLCIILEIWGSLQNNHEILINQNCDINLYINIGEWKKFR